MFVCLKVVSISPWQHSSKAKPVRGLCLTSLFNQTQTHTSGQPGPRYLSLPPSARCTHPALSSSSSSIPSLPPLSLSSAYFPSLILPPSSGSAPLRITLSPASSSLSTSCVLLLVPPTGPRTPSSSFLPPFLRATLPPLDVTASTERGAAASKLGQNWLKMHVSSSPCTCL